MPPSSPVVVFTPPTPAPGTPPAVGIAPASAVLFPDEIAAGDTFSVDGHDYQLSASEEYEEGEWNSAADGIGGIVVAVNGTDGINPAHPTVTAARDGISSIRFTARDPGAAGRAITCSTDPGNTGNGYFATATLTGGSDWPPAAPAAPAAITT